MKRLSQVNFKTDGILFTALIKALSFIYILLFKTSFDFIQKIDENYIFTHLNTLLIVVFFYILYKRNSSDKWKRLLKILGIIALIILLSNLFSDLRGFVDSILNSEKGSWFSIVYAFEWLGNIGFILFVLTKIKKSMFLIMSVGIFFGLLASFNYFSIGLSLFKFTSDISYLIESLIIFIVFLINKFILFFYCYFEIKKPYENKTVDSSVS